VRYTDI